MWALRSKYQMIGESLRMVLHFETEYFSKLPLTLQKRKLRHSREGCSPRLYYKLVKDNGAQRKDGGLGLKQVYLNCAKSYLNNLGHL